MKNYFTLILILIISTSISAQEIPEMNFKKNIMKSLTLTLLTFIISLSGISQLTYVPDDNFENLIETNYGASNGVVNDNYVLTAGLTTTTLYISPLPGQITDLTGIQDFLLLEQLTIDGLTISDINLSNLNIKKGANTFSWNLIIKNCSVLKKIILPHGDLYFNLSNLPYLNSCIFQTDNVLFGSATYGCMISSCNSLTKFDISNISGVEIGTNLYIQVCNHLSCINLKNGKCSNWAKVTILSCPTLFCIEVDDPSFCNSGESIKTWQWKSVSANPNLCNYSTNCNCITGLEEQKNSNYNLTPNPTSSEVKITINPNQLGKTFTLFDNVGRVKMRGVFNSTEYIINLESFEPGIYLLKPSDEDAQIKIVKN